MSDWMRATAESVVLLSRAKSCKGSEKKMERITQEIQELLFQLRDEKYQKFQSSLIPTIEKETMIGVRTPYLKKEAKKLAKRKEAEDFLKNLPHAYFEENQLHAFLIAGICDMEECLHRVNAFLPFINNWATCDQLNPVIFKSHKVRLLASCREWLQAKEEYTVRFGIKMMMDHFLEEEFLKEYAGMIAGITRQEYYIKMMIAWYFATALAKQYEHILPYFEENKLELWVHNKAIQKAVESHRITDEKKEYLKTLRRQGSRKKV